MSAIAARPGSGSTYSPRREEVRIGAMTVEGHALSSVVLGGYVLGPAIGTAPVVIVVGGITALPFPFGDAASGTDPWWPALNAPDLIDPETTTVLCPCWPGNGSTWQGFDEGAIPQLSALGL